MNLSQALQQHAQQLYTHLQAVSMQPHPSQQEVHTLERLLQEHMRIEDHWLLPALENRMPIGSLVRNLEGDHHLMQDLLFQLKLATGEHPSRHALRQLHLLLTRHLEHVERQVHPLIPLALPAHEEQALLRRITSLLPVSTSQRHASVTTEASSEEETPAADDVRRRRPV